MGMLINGKWTDQRPKTVGGRFVRPESQFRNFVSADGSSGFRAEPGRYHLYVSYNCPWAHRTIIFRRLKGLENLISMSVSLPGMREQGWTFDDSYPGSTADAANGFQYLHQAYTLAKPDYTGTVTVPVLWDKQTRTIVNNESPEIIRMLNSAFDGVGATGDDYYPAPLRGEIDTINEYVYAHVNNGVYRTGFATTQEAYDEAVEQLFRALDTLEARLARSRYLVGDAVTEADWRLFVTLARFDAVYYSLFKCCIRPLASYHNVQNYLRDLYQRPGIAETVRLDHIVTGYYAIRGVNPTGIVPRIPSLDFASPHDRARFPEKAAAAA